MAPQHRLLALLILTTAGAVGCRGGLGQRVASVPEQAVMPAVAAIERVVYDEPQATQTPGPADAETPLLLPNIVGEAEEVPAPQLESTQTADPTTPAPPTLTELVVSVRSHFPLIQQAVAARTIASGETLAAWGAFDHKLEGYSNSQPLDFYENYWNKVGVKQDTYWGGQTFVGYRIGRGVYEPWYLERETNRGGELSMGFVAPLARNRWIDANRAELWRAQLEQNRVEPEIRIMVIGSVRDASIAYWQWVAAAAKHRIAQGVLELGLRRVDFLQRQVELGEKAEIDKVDNQRIIVSRRAKLIDARRKLEQSSVKLSLFLRNELGEPVVLPIDSATVDFPISAAPGALGAVADVALAQANRPELESLRFAQRQLNVLLQQASNEMQPQIDAGLFVGQDVGEPTSSKRDKSELEVEATVMLSVPLQRRKAMGKARQLRGKIAQVRAKTRFAADKIAAEAQAAHAALVAAAERVVQTTEGLELAQRMQAAEERLYELGQSTLLNLNLREQQAAEAAVARIDALADYFVAQANYAAALGLESPAELAPPMPAP